MLNILQVLQGGDSFGGVENYLYQYYTHINHDVIHFDFLFITRDTMKTKWSDKALQDSEHATLGLNVRDIRKIRKALLKYLRAHDKYDCVHINTGTITIQSPCLSAARKVGIKCRIAHSHSTGGGKKYSGLKKIIFGFFQHKIFEDATIRAACSYEAGQHIFGDGVSHGDITIIPNAVDTKVYRMSSNDRNNVRNEFGFKNEKVFIQLGSIYSVKNHSFTLDVFHELDKLYDDWRLLIVGKGELEDSIKAKARKLGINNKIIFTGFRDDVHRILQGADVLLMPSLREGFPFSTIEAQAAGLSAICSDKVPNSVDITGNCIFLPLNVDKWVNACIKSRRGSDSQIEKVIEAGFDVSDAADKLTQLYLDNC
jgi:Glycosyltransferase